MKYIYTTLILFSTILYGGNGKIHPATKLINEAKANTIAISPKELKKMIDNEENIYMLDVREILQRSEGQIYADEMYEMTRGDLESYILTKIKDTNATIVTYCRGGTRGILAAQTLKWLGYKDARYLDGGLRAWANAGLPIETGIGVTTLTLDD